MKETLLYYQNINGLGWTDVAVISTLSEFTTNLASDFIDVSYPEVSVLSYQQFLGNEESLDVEFSELAKSKARVFIALIFGNWETFIEKANNYGLVGEQYVYIVPSTVCDYAFSAPSRLSQGILGATYYVTENTPQINDFLNYWNSVDPSIYPAAGPGTVPSPHTYRTFDMMMIIIKVLDQLEKQGEINSPISPIKWSQMIRNITFEGLSGDITFRPNGDRIGTYSMRFYDFTLNKWITTSRWSEENGLEHINDVIWYSNTTEIPDLDIREPFHYWSCEKKEKLFDKTGKTIEIQTPDGDNDINNIDIDYHCDYFIDCNNSSDEISNCDTNYLILYILFGIITGVLILLCMVIIFIVILFGKLLKYRRLRRASPTFLILLLIAMIIGYSSIYAWFGKPHPVACGFQPWLLGLSTISMISALCVKNIRIWRIFKLSHSRQVKITDFQLFILWIISIIPAVFILILWTIISTPTAEMKYVDGDDHYLCTTGGFTGEPGGLVFFFCFVAYCAFILIIGAIISFLIRNVPSQFNETKLLTISIYNLGFLSAVIIPVFMVVNPINPFAAWIIRSSAILYAFTATLILQFLPILIGIFIVDKGQNVKVFKSSLRGPKTSSNTANTGGNTVSISMN